MQSLVHRVSASDGWQLTARSYTVTSKPEAVVLIASAIGVRQRYYQSYARFLAEHGFTAVTFDYRGIGDSKPASLRGFGAHLHDWGELDLWSMIEWCRTQFPQAQLKGVGHSVGGQLFGLAANNQLLDRLVTVCAQSGYWRHWPGVGRLGMWAFYQLMPMLTRVLSYFPASRIVARMEDLPAGVAKQWAHWGLNADYMRASGRASVANFQTFEGALLAYSFSDDNFAPKPAVDWLANQYTHAKQMRRRHVIPEEAGVRRVQHFGFFRPEFREVLWPESLAWLSTARVADTPAAETCVSLAEPLNPGRHGAGAV